MEAGKKKGFFALPIYLRRSFLLLCFSLIFLLYSLACSNSPPNPLAYTQAWVAVNVTSGNQLLRFLFSHHRSHVAQLAERDGDYTGRLNVKRESRLPFQEARQNRPTGGNQVVGENDANLLLSEERVENSSVVAEKRARKTSISQHGKTSRGDKVPGVIQESENPQNRSPNLFTADARISKNQTANGDTFSTVTDTSYTVGRNSSSSEEGFDNRITSSGKRTGQQGNTTSWTVSEFRLSKDNTISASRTNASAHSIGKLGGDTVSANTTLKNLKPNNAAENVDSSDKLISPSTSENAYCDISLGKWVRDDSYPLYPPALCPFIDPSFRCMENGRPDSDYMKWRWKPQDCQIPRMNGTDFLERLRNKRLVMVGDSLNRNQFESLLCILHESIPIKSRMFEINGDPITKGQGSYAFKFMDYNCSVEFYRSSFLVEEGTIPINGSTKTREILRLDKIDTYEKNWRNAHIILFNTGHWWTHTKTERGRNYFQEGDHLYKKLNVLVAYKKALRTWARWVDKHVNPEQTQVYFRGYSPSHFWGGQWDSGGQCHEEQKLIFNSTHLSHYPDKMEVVEEVLQQMKIPAKLLNVTRLSDYRKDAHPSIYGYKVPNGGVSQDCSHWCLPGLPDIWNELFYALLLRN